MKNELKKFFFIVIMTASLFLNAASISIIVLQSDFIDKQKEVIDDNYAKIRELQYQVFERDSLIMELESDLMK